MSSQMSEEGVKEFLQKKKKMLSPNLPKPLYSKCR